MRWHLIVNAGLFQVAWFAAVLGGSIAAAAACLVLGCHAALRGNVKADVTLAALLAAVGLGLDTLWIHTGMLDYHGALIAPVWIVVLWVAVGMSLNHSLAGFVRRPGWGALAAALSAPMSYSAGAALGAVAPPQGSALAAIAFSWFVVFGLLFRYVVPAVNSFHPGEVDTIEHSRLHQPPSG